MPKNLESKNENKGKSSIQGRGQKAGRDEGPGNANAFRQQVREERSDNNNGSQQKVRDEKPGNMSDYRQQIREKKLASGSKSKNGCVPKLFMLLLPLLAVGTMLLLRS